MGFLRRLIGGANERANNEGANEAEAGDVGSDAAAPSTEEIDDEERARELELLRGEQDRLDELILRQQRYADRSWVPPSQGGTRRSDDGEDTPSEGR
jgi:hypothetical protein